MPRTFESDVELAYDLAGSGETLVLVHGSWSDRHNWQAVNAALAASFEVVSYDRRGNGESGRSANASRRDHEDDLAALIDELGGGPVHVAATSFGASIAIGLASRRPDTVRSLVAHEPPLVGRVADDPALESELAAVQTSVETVVSRVERGDPVGAARQFVEEVALGRGAWDLLPDPLRETMVASAPAFVAEQEDPLWATVELDALASLDCPLLLSRGDTSPAWFSPIVAKLAGAIGHAEVHTYRGAGHAPHLTHPAEYIDTVAGFLSRLPHAPVAAAGVR